MIMLRDITEIVRSEYVKTVEKLSDIMIASASHDMRTPLNTIINMIKLVQNKVADKNILKWLGVANNSANLLMYIVNDTLDFYQIKSGKFSLRPEAFSINEMVEQGLDLVAL
jgi:signal transduction histidine kinase